MKYLLFVLLFLFLFACKHNETITPSSVANNEIFCDTTVVSYSKDVMPVLKQYCYACHAGSAAINGYNFADFNNIQILALDTFHYIPNVIDTNSHLRMPPKGYPIPDKCSINKMRAWVNSGAKNN